MGYAMEENRTLRFLDDPKENKEILKKLPIQITNRWCAKVMDYERKHDDDYPPFQDFAEFISDEARKACHPSASIQALGLVNKRSHGNRQNKESKSNYNAKE